MRRKRESEMRRTVVRRTTKHRLFGCGGEGILRYFGICSSCNFGMQVYTKVFAHVRTIMKQT